jgi:hypothetical protein
MGQRIYKQILENVTIAAVQDIFSLKAGAANGCELHQIDLSAGGVIAPAEIRLRLKIGSTVVSQGSGGTAPTPSNASSGDTKAANAVLHCNDTTPATTTGAFRSCGAWQWNVLLPFQYLPAPEDREEIAAGEAVILEIPTGGTPASTVVSGTIVWRENT